MNHVLIFDGMTPQMVDIRSPGILVTSTRVEGVSQASHLLAQLSLNLGKDVDNRAANTYSQMLSMFTVMMFCPDWGNKTETLPLGVGSYFIHLPSFVSLRTFSLKKRVSPSEPSSCSIYSSSSVILCHSY